jgi:hypothetical protein
MARDGGIAIVVEEQDPGVGSGRHRLSEHCTAHVPVTSGFEQQRAPKVVNVTFHPITLLRHRLAGWPRETLDNQAQRLAGNVRIDGFHGLTHAPPSDAKGCDALRTGHDPTAADAARRRATVQPGKSDSSAMAYRLHLPYRLPFNLAD